MFSIHSKQRRMRAAARGRWAIPLGLLVGLLVLPAPAPAQQSTIQWNCRASALRVELGGEIVAEPVVANGSGVRCPDERAGNPFVSQGSGGVADPTVPAVRVTEEGAYAETDLVGEGGATFAQQAISRAGADSARVEVGYDQPGGAPLVIELEGIRSRASGSCVGGVPTFGGTFDIATARINGNEVSLDELAGQIATGLQEAGFDPLVRIDVGAQATSGDAAAGEQAFSIRALDVQLLGAPEPVGRLVVGESAVGRTGDVCAAPPCPAGTIPNSQGQCVLIVFPPCPEGSTQNELGQCVVPAGPDGECPGGSLRSPEGVCVLIVTPPCPQGSVDNGQGQCVLPFGPGIPTGGQVVPPEAIPAQLARRCSNRAFGSQVGILGTEGNDRITGTNRSDRIFGLGGRDRISGGRGNDCLEGGSGSDNLDGSNGTDLMLGADGRDIQNGGTGDDTLRGEGGHDKLAGGSGNDRMEGGSGRDRLSGGFGRDRMFGGSDRDYMDGGNGADQMSGGTGNDAINASTSGRGRDVVDCGPGRDVVRINRTDRVRNCERVMVVRRR
jgi:hypothetical protein